MKLGVFSGTFDPVHNGHIGFALEARQRLNLDKIVFMPEALPRRKSSVSNYEQRKEMLSIVLADYDWAEIYAAKTNSHSVKDTLLELKSKCGNETEFYFLMGVDVYEHLQEWPNHEELINGADIVLGLRTEDDGELAIELAAKLGDDPTMIVSSHPGLSSSKIRHGDQTGVDPRIAQYIEENSLYV